MGNYKEKKAKLCFIPLLLLLSLFSFPSSYAATIHGTIYDSSLEKAVDVKVSIDTVPVQFILSKDSEYSFDVPAGTYTLTAEKYDYKEVRFRMEDEITVNSDGNYRMDIILLPVFDDFGEEETDFIEDSIAPENKNISTFVILFAALIFLLLSFLIFYFLRRSRKKKNDSDNSKEESVPDDLEEIYSYIKKQKRTTQKDIRKNFPLSEAKISLIISELEDKDKIRKLKKGRGNIIICK